MVGVLVYQNLKKGEKISFEEKTMPENLENKKIALIIAFKDFRDEEYFVPREVFEETGAEIKTVSTQMGKAIGADGGEAEVDLEIEDLKVSDFDAIVFIGGPGMVKNIDSQPHQRIAKETVAAGKILAAICISPAILAKSGVLSGKKATVWSSPMDKSAVKILQENGADYQEEPVVIDGKIVTASGPAAAEEFAKKIVELLK